MKQNNSVYKKQNMKPIKMYFVKCNKIRKFVNPKISYIFDKTLILFTICGKCGDNNDRIIREENNFEILKIPGLIQERFHLNLINILNKKMSLEFRLKK